LLEACERFQNAGRKWKYEDDTSLEPKYRVKEVELSEDNRAEKLIEEIKKFQESAGNAKSWEEIVQEHKTTKEKLAVALEALEFIFENEYSSVAEAALMEIEKMGGTGD
jgi:CTP synthase (UTP-ammonia lyase)